MDELIKQLGFRVVPVGPGGYGWQIQYVAPDPDEPDTLKVIRVVPCALPALWVLWQFAVTEATPPNQE